jgi:hypothetical protein
MEFLHIITNESTDNTFAKQSPSEDDSRSLNQEIPPILKEVKFSLPCSQEPATGLYN